MFRIRGKGLVFLSFLILPFISGQYIIAQELSDVLRRADTILEQRGEVVFEFYPNDTMTIRDLNTFISIDRRTSKGFQAYANEMGFRRFLGYNIPFKLLESQGRKKSGAGSGEFPGDWDSYPSHDQYISFMRGMADKYPEICRLDTIGQSVDGRYILVIKITDQPDLHETEPAFVYSSSMHGDEPTGYVILLRMIDYLCSNYGKDALVTKLVDNIEIWINPLANPDGAYFQEAGGDTVPKRFNSNAADLNRNFPGIPNLDNPDGMSCQPETLAQMKFLKSIYMVMGANIHGGAEVMNYPYDTWPDLHADDDWYRRTSLEYADQAQTRAFPVKYMFDTLYWPYGITNGWDWYWTEGSRQDWVNYFRQAREVTLEISLAKSPIPEELPFFWYYNYPSMLRYMEQSLFGIHGIIRDESTLGPLKASIKVLDHDTLNSGINSDSLNGYFARLIEPGTWDLEISIPGYESLQIQDLQVSPDQTTWLDVNLSAIPSGVDVEWDLNIYPNPFVYQTELSIPVKVPGSYRIFLYDMRGTLVLEDRMVYENQGRHIYSLEGAHLEKGVYLLKLISPDGARTEKIFKSQKK